MRTYDARISETAVRYRLLQKLLNVEGEQLQAAFRVTRDGAFGYGDLERAEGIPVGDLDEHLGSVPDWDAYFVSTNLEA